MLSSSIWLARIQMFANDRPWTKLGYDSHNSIYHSCIYHFIMLTHILHKSLHCHTHSFGIFLCATNHIPSIVISHYVHSCILSPCSYSCLACFFSSPSKSQWSVEIYTTFLVACVGYHGNDYKQTMIGFMHFFFSMMTGSCMNMVPNALLIRKL